MRGIPLVASTSTAAIFWAVADVEGPYKAYCPLWHGGAEVFMGYGTP